MSFSPSPSNFDFPFLFEDFHDQISIRLLEFAESWKPEEYRDDWLATRVAVQNLSAANLIKLCIPEQYEGEAVNHPSDIDVRSITLARECLGYLDGLLDCAFAMQGLGSYPIIIAGTDEQKSKYLPGFMSGDRVGAFALTEPNAGSDVVSLKTKARKQKNGDYLITGSKTFISNAGVANQYIVFATVNEKKKAKGITAFIVESDDPGIKIEPFEVIAPHPIGTIHFKRTRVPASRRLGAEGEGFKIAMKTLNTYRLSVAGAALGMAKRALDEALAHAMKRKQFGKALIEQQQIAAYLADSATELDAARLLVYRAAYLRHIEGESPPKEVAMGKLFATEYAQKIIDRCLQIHGGLGVKKGNVLERLYREIRALRIYEGASEIQKVIIAKSLKKEYEAEQE
jgi:acyl-CoA dehydrogenase